MTSGRYRLLLTVCWLTIQVLAHGQQPSPSAAQPKRLLSTQELQNLLAAPDDKACQSKLARAQESEQAIRDWYAVNKPIHDEALRENEALRSQFADTLRQFPLGFGLGAGSVVALAVLVGIYRKRFVPKTSRGKQVSVLIPAAVWCSFCFLGIANDSEMMLHPINAAVTALFWVSPALLFGGLLFWWFSPERCHPSSRVKQLSASGTGN